MNIEGCVALVTARTEVLAGPMSRPCSRRAAKVYAAARDPSAILDARLNPVCLDVTSPTDILAAAEACPDVNLLINNAGVMLKSPMLAEGSEDALRREMEVNVYGVLAMVRAFGRSSHATAAVRSSICCRW